MRCLNCHTVLMDGDARCLSCGMFTGSDKDPGALWKLAAYDPNARRKYLRMKWGGGLTSLVVGAVLAVVGGLIFHDAQFSSPEAREVKAAELLKIKKAEELPGWIVCSPSRVVETGEQYVKLRSRQVTSKFVLLEIGDRWLLAQVDPRYSGGRIEGQLEEADRLVHPRVEATFRNHGKTLLPYQLQAEYSVSATTRQNSILGGILGGFGILIFISGIGLLMMKPPPPMPGDGATTTPARPPIQVQVPPTGPAQTRSPIVRVISGVVWVVVFFFVGALVASALATQGAGEDEQLRAQLIEESSRTVGPWVLLGSILVASVLGALGILPGTRRRT